MGGHQFETWGTRAAESWMEERVQKKRLVHFSVCILSKRIMQEQIQVTSTGKATYLLCGEVFLTSREYSQAQETREQQFRGYQEIAQLVAVYQGSLQGLERDLLRAQSQKDSRTLALSDFSLQLSRLNDGLALLAWLTGFAESDGITKEREAQRQSREEKG